MKITIDTKEDSHEDIKKIVALLSQLIGKDAVTNAPNLFENPTSAELPGLMNMFDVPAQNNSEREIQKASAEAPKVELY